MKLTLQIELCFKVSVLHLNFGPKLNQVIYFYKLFTVPYQKSFRSEAIVSQAGLHQLMVVWLNHFSCPLPLCLSMPKRVNWLKLSFQLAL